MRYIDADALIKKIFPYDGVDKKGYSINAKAVADAIANIPPADVVTKREVFLASSDSMNMLIECHGYALTHDADVKRDAAREIFAEIETECQWHMDAYKYSSFGESIMRNVIKSIAELKKKYTEEK